MTLHTRTEAHHSLSLECGWSYRGLCFKFQVPHNDISCILREVSSVFLAEYQDEVFYFPTIPDMWKDIASCFRSHWNFTMLVALLMAGTWPQNIQSTIYYNYKGFCSVVLLGLIHADYRFCLRLCCVQCFSALTKHGEELDQFPWAWAAFEQWPWCALLLPWRWCLPTAPMADETLLTLLHGLQRELLTVQCPPSCRELLWHSVTPLLMSADDNATRAGDCVMHHPAMPYSLLDALSSA